ncbi:rab11 family-interacting protein 1 isoform X2 [Anolis carolinensis]|uniref:rab11 family-interacting protein 1 isoform X2 n=1 Tax=Anolis carolinensis TaxID=28377 RepID=UPI002F2B7CB4
MSLPGSPSSLGSRWAPTHVQVTVLQARGLRAKAKGGQGSDAYAVMALGKEKFATSVAERCSGAPAWREEATFELPPPPRQRGGGLGLGHDEGDAPLATLQLTVFHRALLGLDKFLGRAEISLAELQAEGGRHAKRWYKLHSKPGKKEKERGEIEVDIQFMRSNMTASMFDLSMKDKSRNPFGKLKDKLKGKRGNGLPDTASAIIPSISRSPADSEEESNEKEKKKSKFKTLFTKPGLQKNTLSQSMSVLPTLQPVSEKRRLNPSDFQSKWDDDDDDKTLTPVSDKPSRTEDNLLSLPSETSHKRTGSGDSKQLNQMSGSNTKKDSHSRFGGLKSKNDPASRSNVCINGSHVYMETKSDTLPKDNIPSSPSSQAFQRKRLFLSQENLASEVTKEPEAIGRLPPDKVPPGSSSLESFKAMTLPSYKLLSGGDLLESHTPTPVISDTPKETKENKKQENKKPSLLSLVTGKKETKINEEGEESSDNSLKAKGVKHNEKEVKHNEKELLKKETNPFEVPVDHRKGHGPEKSSGTDVPNTKASLNPFNVEEEQPEKSSFAVKPSQTKPVKPRLGVSSEDETKATFTLPVSPSASSFYPSYRSHSENNPFTFKEEAEQKSQASERFASLANLSIQHYSNPFTPTWEEQSKEQDSNSSAVTSLHHISPVSGKENNPFSPHWGLESQAEGPENVIKPSLDFQHLPVTPVFEPQPFSSQPSNINDPLISEEGKDSESLKSASTSFASTSLSPKLSDSMMLHVVPSEKSQNKGVSNQTDPGSVSISACSYDQVEMIAETQADENVHIVPPFEENNGRMKKSVTFVLSKPKDNEVVSSSDEDVLGEDQVEMWSDNENNMLKSVERDRRQRLELDVEPSSASVSHDEKMHSVHNSKKASADEAESGSLLEIEPPVPVPRVHVPLPKETTTSSSSCPPTPPKPAPRSALKQRNAALPQTSVSGAGDVSVFKELSSDSSVSSGKLADASSLTTSDSTIFPFTEDVSNTDPSESINNQPNHVISTQTCIAVTGELNLKSSALPVIPEVGSDDEQLNDDHKSTEKMSSRGDLPRSGNDFREREPASVRKATDDKQTLSVLVKVNRFDSALKHEDLSASPSGVIQGTRGLEEKNSEIIKEKSKNNCPFSDKAVSLSNSSFHSDGLGCNNAESLKTATTEGLDAKVEPSGQKKLLQAWVSPSETHPIQTPQSGGSYPPKLRLQPVKPMNTTPSKPPAKTSNIATKIMDNQNEANLKKYDSSDPAYAYAQLTHDELIQLVLKQKDLIAKRDLQVRELENYIDDLLVKVMEETPNILRVQAFTNKKAGKI